MADTHKIFEKHNTAAISSLQLRNDGNEKLREFTAQIPLATIRETVAKTYGPGYYTLVALDQKRKQLSPFKHFQITDGEALAMLPKTVADAAPEDRTAALVMAGKQLDVIRERLEKQEAKLEEREAEVRDTWERQTAEHRDRMEELDLEYQGKLEEAQDEITDGRAELTAEIDQGRAELATERATLIEGLYSKHRVAMAEAEERGDKIIARAEDRAERIVRDATEEANRLLDKARRYEDRLQSEQADLREREHELNRRERDLIREAADNRAAIEREKLEYKMEMDRQHLLAEMDRRVEKVQQENSSGMSKEVKDDYHRAQIDRMFSEEPEILKLARQFAPLFLGGSPLPLPPDAMDVNAMEMQAPEMPAYFPSFPSPEEQVAAMPPVGSNPYEDAPQLREERIEQERIEQEMPPPGVNLYSDDEPRATYTPEEIEAAREEDEYEDDDDIPTFDELPEPNFPENPV